MALATNFQEQCFVIRVLIADDSAVIRGSLASLLNPKTGFRVVGLASDGLEVVEKAGKLLPDVIIMDAQFGRSRRYQAYQANHPSRRHPPVQRLYRLHGGRHGARRRRRPDEGL